MKNTKPTGRTLDMTKGSPMKLLFTFALPLFLGNLLQQFYNLADTSIAGHLLGDAALAQIGATSALYSLITNFAFGLNNGLALNVSRSFGAGDKKEMKRSVCWMVTLAFISALVMTVGFLMFRKPLLTVMQTPEDVLDGALSYFTVILAGIPLTMAYNLESALLQSMGNSVTPLGFLLFSSILNVILDFFFIQHPVFYVSNQCPDIFQITFCWVYPLRLLINARQHGSNAFFIREKLKRHPARLPAIVLNHPGTDTINGPKFQSFCHLLSEFYRKPICHILRCRHRVGDCQNFSRIHSFTIDHVTQPCHQHCRFPRSRHRQKKHWPVHTLHGTFLLLI